MQHKTGMLLGLAVALAFAGPSLADKGSGGDGNGNSSGQGIRSNSGRGSVDYCAHLGNDGDTGNSGGLNTSPAVSLRRLRVPLMSTAAGAAASAEGKVDLRVRGQRQQF